MRRAVIDIARRVVPSEFLALMHRWGRRGSPVGRAQFGSLRRVKPLSRQFGFDRGLPVDRYYIEDFLSQHATDICGHVLEVRDNTYTKRYGGNRVTESDIISISREDGMPTIVADLTAGDQIPSGAFDCIIFTQTLHLIYDTSAALKTLSRILKPRGVLLATVPGISQICRDNNGDWVDYWRFTSASAQKSFSEVFPPEDLQVSARGNVLSAIAFLEGLAAEELTRQELDHLDPDFEVIVCVRAVKGGLS